jgi:hypothetical protein
MSRSVKVKACILESSQVANMKDYKRVHLNVPAIFALEINGEISMEVRSVNL